MKAAFLLIQFSICASLWAEESEALVPEKQQLGGVEERRAEAMGQRLERFETMAGRVYRDVWITKITEAGISFSHAAGAARLRFEDLSPEQRRYFGINRKDAAEVYAREMKARLAYEKQVEEKEKTRREQAAKEAAKRAELERLAMEKAEKNRAASASEPAETIPLYPTIKRVDSGGRRYSSRYSSYGSYYGGYGYRYPVRYNYRPAFRYGGGRCLPIYRSGVHFTIR